MTRLEARALACAYDQHAVLHDLSLTVQPGEILALLGPNGAGKTTLL
jgi:ABC-type multidrug transport system ATPase subunit